MCSSLSAACGGACVAVIVLSITRGPDGGGGARTSEGTSRPHEERERGKKEKKEEERPKEREERGEKRENGQQEEPHDGHGKASLFLPTHLSGALPTYQGGSASAARKEEEKHLCLPPYLAEVRPLGSGAYGEVYLCEDQRTATQVAVKWIRNFAKDPLTGKRTLREIRLLDALRHENLLQLIDILPVPQPDFDDVYIVCPYMQTDLHRVIYSKVKLLEAHAQAFTCQILRGLKYLHSAGVMHRDLKPENVFVNKDCKLRIADFGLARGRCNVEEQLTDYVVTRWYRAPELILLPAGYFDAVDLWSVGCIHVELLAREPLFPGKDHLDMLKCIAATLGFAAEQDLKWVPAKDEEEVKRMLRVMGLPARPDRSLKRRLPNVSEVCLDFISRLLDKVPTTRMSAADAIAHAYLAHLHDPACETTSQSQFSWDFDNFDPTQRALKDYVYAECARHHPEIIARDAEVLKSRGFSSPFGSSSTTAAAPPQPQGASALEPDREQHIRDRMREQERENPKPPDIDLPEYLGIVQCLSASASSEVYLCEDQDVGTQVVVKLFRDFAKDIVDGKRLLREVRILAAMRHENLQQLVDVLPVPHPEFADFYIVLPYMRLNLHQCAKMKLLESHCQAFTCQILRGLKYLHSAGIMHRNLKPTSILVNEDSTLNIADFGLARGYSDEEEPLADHPSTRSYRAPEMILLPASYFEAADLWSVGCMHVELLIKKACFPGKDQNEVLRRIASTLGFSAERDLDWVPARDREEVLRMLSTLRLPEQPRKALEDRLPNVSENCLDLVRRLLDKTPTSRISAAEAIEHPYLAHLRDQARETTSPCLFTWEGDTSELTKRALKDHVYAECARHHPEIIPRDADWLRTRGFPYGR